MTNKKSILVVDDEVSVLQIMKKRLEIEHYEVVTESSGKKAVEIVKANDFLVVLLDLGLPDLNGLEVLKQIKILRPALPVILVTGYHDEEEARKAMDLGALDYITKPFNFEYLLNVLSLQG